MRVAEILCLGVLDSDLEAGLRSGLNALSSAPIRHSPARTPEKMLEVVRRLTIAWCARQVLARFLRNHGIAHEVSPGAHGLGRSSSRLRIRGELMSLRIFHLPAADVPPHLLLEAPALVSLKAWHRRRHYSAFIFAFWCGDMALALRLSRSGLVDAAAPLTRPDVHLRAGKSRLFVTAAASIVECEEKFSTIDAGTVCLQFPGGLPATGMGCPIAALSAFSQKVPWGGV